MKVSELDKGIIIPNDFNRDDLAWINIKEAPFAISGVYFDDELNQYTRMPHSVSSTVSDGVCGISKESTGGRVRFKTDSKFLGFYAKLSGGYNSTFDMFQKIKGSEYFDKYTYIGAFAPLRTVGNSLIEGYMTDGVMVDYCINFPSRHVYDVFVALDRDSEILEPTPYRIQKPIVFYGSSITQGAGASKPGNTYEAIISKHLDAEYINLGFGGNAKGEQEMAEYIAKLDMSAFVLDYDHNSPNAEYLWNTHLDFFRTIRKAQPDLPIIILTAPNTMPWYDWYQPRRDAIYNTYKTAISEGDKNVYFIDGSTLFGDVDRDLCTVDTCHPTDLGYWRMALKIEETLAPLFENIK